MFTGKKTAARHRRAPGVGPLSWLLFATVEFIDESAASQLIDETQVDEIFNFSFGCFWIPDAKLNVFHRNLAVT
jgi:hypothetical protein